MNKRIPAAVLTAALLLAGCAEDSSQTGAEKGRLTETSAVTAQKRMSYYDDETEQQVLRVKPLGYADSMLTYEYEGELFTLSMPNDVFGDPEAVTKQTVSEIVLQNKGGRDLLADIILSEDKQSIIFCDALGPNGIHKYSEQQFARDNGEDFLTAKVSMRRTGGSEVEFSVGGKTIKGDLNDMMYLYKGRIPDSVDSCCFRGYQYRDGDLLLRIIFDDESGESYSCGDLIGFFGTVLSVEGDRAKVQLNDGLTVCDVPTALHDDEVTAGQRTMLIIEAGEELYGSGETYKSDYAVFVSQFDTVGTDESKFPELAYSEPSKTDLYKRTIVSKTEAEVRADER
ncbi:MAG: hypothetical protein IKP47_02780 [Ruminococcus sp.]|nr:hypothetical protein [Ruminococcus sp.]